MLTGKQGVNPQTPSSTQLGAGTTTAPPANPLTAILGQITGPAIAGTGLDITQGLGSLQQLLAGTQFQQGILGQQYGVQQGQFALQGQDILAQLGLFNQTQNANNPQSTEAQTYALQEQLRQIARQQLPGQWAAQGANNTVGFGQAVQQQNINEQLAQLQQQAAQAQSGYTTGQFGRQQTGLGYSEQLAGLQNQQAQAALGQQYEQAIPGVYSGIAQAGAGISSTLAQALGSLAPLLTSMTPAQWTQLLGGQ